MSSDNSSLEHVALKGALMGLWAVWLERSRASRARRIAAGLPSRAEHLGYHVARIISLLRH